MPIILTDELNQMERSDLYMPHNTWSAFVQTVV